MIQCWHDVGITGWCLHTETVLSPMRAKERAMIVASFWLYLPDSTWRYVTLDRDVEGQGQDVQVFSRSEPNEEGYEAEETMVHITDCGTKVQRVQCVWGRDCDGPYSAVEVTECPISQLSTVEPHSSCKDELPPGTKLPNWAMVHAEQEDVYAEAMGY